jgi:hypothetical protein
MNRHKTFHSEFRHRGHRVVICEIPVPIRGSVLNGFESAYVAEVHDSLHSFLDLESPPHSKPDEAAIQARSFIDEVVDDELDDLK